MRRFDIFPFSVWRTSAKRRDWTREEKGHGIVQQLVMLHCCSKQSILAPRGFFHDLADRSSVLPPVVSRAVLLGCRFLWGVERLEIGGGELAVKESKPLPGSKRQLKHNYGKVRRNSAPY